MDRTAEKDRKAAQELKNDQDFIYATNQSLQNLSVAFEGLRKEFSLHSDQVGSKLKSQEINIEKLGEKNAIHQKSCNDVLDECRRNVQGCLDAYETNAKNSLFSTLSLDSCIKSIKTLQEGFSRLESDSDRIEQLIISEVLRLANLIESRAKNLKEEIISIPSEVPSLKSAIEEKVEIFNVNFQGVLRELEVMKKSAFVSQKYIEDLYTKMGRIKEGLK